MTHKQFMDIYIKPHLDTGSLLSGSKPIDQAANRELYHNTKDSLHREGLITNKQVNNWVYPCNRYFTGARI